MVIINDQATLLPWQKSSWDTLSSYIQQKRIPQALLITGKQGIGKRQLASHFAQTLICEQPLENGLFCNQCHGCRLYSAQTHPDVVNIQPLEPGKNITIVQIRTLIELLALKPHYKTHRVILLYSAEKMNNAAANGFLKCLEEPSPNTIILLVTSSPSLLPATIRSRCQRLNMPIPDHSVALTWLQQQTHHDQSELLLSLAQGAPSLAKDLAKQDILELRQQCFVEWIRVFKKQSDPVSVSEIWIKNDLTQIHQWLLSWVIDLMRYSYAPSFSIAYNPDLQVQLQELIKHINLKKLDYHYQLLLISKHRLSTQINKQLLSEELLINWADTRSRI